MLARAEAVDYIDFIQLVRPILASALLSMSVEFNASSMTSTSPRPGSTGYCPVLIVEDDADLREMMAQLLALEGFHAEAVANGREALTYLQGGARPNIILLDLMMPVMDGWEFRRRQVEDPDIAWLPVVVLSALDQARGVDLRGTAFLKKPLDFDRLLALVRQFCARMDC